MRRRQVNNPVGRVDPSAPFISPVRPAGSPGSGPDGTPDPGHPAFGIPRGNLREEISRKWDVLLERDWPDSIATWKDRRYASM